MLDTRAVSRRCPCFRTAEGPETLLWPANRFHPERGPRVGLALVWLDTEAPKPMRGWKQLGIVGMSGGALLASGASAYVVGPP